MFDGARAIGDQRSLAGQEVVDAGAQLRPLGLGDVEMAPEIEQSALSDGVSDALVVDEPMCEVGLSVVCALCLSAANEHGAQGNRGWRSASSIAVKL